MKGITKILFRYVLSAAGIALILLIINFIALFVLIVQSSQDDRNDFSISQLSKSLSSESGVYILSENGRNMIEKQYQWAMLIDNGGNVVWSIALPTDVPKSYTLSDVAVFTRWYLNDYPVTVWRRTDGLFVLGNQKGSIWKYSMQESQTVMDSILAWIPAVLILNGLVAILLALVLGLRLFRSLKPLAKGIEDMAENRPVELSTKGLLGTLASGINKTSEKLIAQEAELAKRDNARTNWIAGISHDIRTPLSIVMGYASELEEDSGLPPAKREQAGVIRSQSERIRALVSDLNLASRLEYDMQPLKMTAVPLASLLRSIITDFFNGGLPDTYSIDLEISENSQNTVFEGDEGLLKRAVSNLIDNSVKHNPDGCSIKVSLKRDGTICTLSVSDNGTGFRQDVLENLKAPQSLTELQNHSLGLIIVQQIIKAHHGIAEFHNLPQGGCEAVLSVPVLAEQKKA